MLVIVSPAKRLNENPVAKFEPTEPVFQDEAGRLASIARELNPDELQKLMGISEKLALLNRDRFRDFGAMVRGPAALMFDGDTYAGLEAASLDRDEMDWAADHLRILSGLYGLLRPTDEIEPYRLEMGSKLTNPRGKTLYEFWGDRISRALNEQARKIGCNTLVNCASQEYFGAVDRNALELRVVEPVFMEMRAEAPKIVSFFAKKARGAMARFVVQNRLVDPEDLKDFDTGGYRFNADMSQADRWVFLRDENVQAIV